MRQALTLLSVTVFLSGCFSTVREEPPAPIVGNGGGSTSSAEPQSRQSGSVTITPLQQTAAMPLRPAPGRAVQVLLERSRAQQQAGDLTAAAKSLERALGIEPKNPQIWNQLAHLRAAQSNYGMAAELAAKSNMLASPADNSLKHDNWLLIAKMKKTQGMMAEASAAQRQADLVK